MNSNASNSNSNANSNANTNANTNAGTGMSVGGSVGGGDASGGDVDIVAIAVAGHGTVDARVHDAVETQVSGCECVSKWNGWVSGWL